MQRRRLGQTELELTIVGVGTWAIGGGNWLFGWGNQQEQDSVAAMRRAIELGVNWIDTAPIYGLGHAEKVVGKLLADIPESERPIVATKFGRYEKEDKAIGGRLDHASIIAECESSLRNLGVECIDLYQMHWPDPDQDIEQGWQACVDLVEQGKVRYIGVSNQNVVQMSRLMPIAPIASLQPPYSLLQREIENEILPYCESNAIGVVCYSPMGKGLLTGAFNRERVADLPDNDHRRRDPAFQGQQFEINLRFVDQLQEIAAGSSRRLAQLAIAWCLRKPMVTSAIVGIRQPEQIEEIVGSMIHPLSDGEVRAIEAAISEREEACDSLA